MSGKLRRALDWLVIVVAAGALGLYVNIAILFARLCGGAVSVGIVIFSIAVAAAVLVAVGFGSAGPPSQSGCDRTERTGDAP